MRSNSSKKRNWIRPNFLFLRTQHYGVYSDQSNQYIAYLTESGGKIEIHSLSTYFEATTPHTQNVKPLDIGDSLPKKKKNTSVACGISGSKTLIKPFLLELTKPDEITEALPYQVEQTIPYPIESCIVDKIILQKNKENTKLLSFTALKKDIERCIEQTTQSFEMPEFVIPKALALAQFSRLFFQKKDHIIIDLGYDETILVLMSQGIPLGTRTLHTTLVTKQRDTAKEQEGNHLKQFANELLHAIASFQNAFSRPQSLPVTFTGASESDPQILLLLSKLIGMHHQTIEKKPADVIFSPQITFASILSFAIPIGLALAGTKKRCSQLIVNFRQKELSHPHPWAHFKRDLCLYFSLMTICFFSLYLIFNQNLTTKKLHCTKQYTQIAKLLEIPVSTNIFSYDDVEKKLYEAQQILKTAGDEIPLHANIPRVSDILAFLCSHPKIIANQTENSKKQMKLQSFAYVLVKRPEIGKLKERYQVRVDVEFSAPNTTCARELHESLMKPNAFIDQQKGITWTMQKGIYKTSFFLKDKTQYPIGGAS